jgi:hypothetical protein
MNHSGRVWRVWTNPLQLGLVLLAQRALRLFTDRSGLIVSEAHAFFALPDLPGYACSIVGKTLRRWAHRSLAPLVFGGAKWIVISKKATPQRARFATLGAPLTKYNIHKNVGP